MKKIICQTFQDVFDNLEVGDICVSRSWSNNKKCFIIKKEYEILKNSTINKYYIFPKILGFNWFKLSDSPGYVKSDWIIYKL